MKYLLDFSNVQHDAIPDDIKHFKIPCKTGEYQLDFDLIECDIPKDIYLKLTSKRLDEVNDLPIGVNVHTLPAGTVITVLKDD